jgi:cytochrome c biogenesis protein CcdA
VEWTKGDIGMKPIDFLALYYVRFIAGFSILATFIGLVNFGFIVMTYVTVKGFNISSWVIPVIIGATLFGCISLGTIFERYKVWDKVTSFQNQRMNPEIRNMHKTLNLIAKKLDVEEV